MAYITLDSVHRNTGLTGDFGIIQQVAGAPGQNLHGPLVDPEFIILDDATNILFEIGITIALEQRQPSFTINSFGNCRQRSV